MKLGYVVYYVQSVEETLSFYEKAFGLSRKFFHESGDYGELETGTTSLAFASLKLGESNGVGLQVNRPTNFSPSDMEIGLVTDDVVAAHQKALSAGAKEVKAPVQKPWGQTVSYVRDNNSFLVELCSPVGL